MSSVNLTNPELDKISSEVLQTVTECTNRLVQLATEIKRLGIEVQKQETQLTTLVATLDLPLVYPHQASSLFHSTNQLNTHSNNLAAKKASPRVQQSFYNSGSHTSLMITVPSKQNVLVEIELPLLYDESVQNVISEANLPHQHTTKNTERVKKSNKVWQSAKNLLSSNPKHDLESQSRSEDVAKDLNQSSEFVMAEEDQGSPEIVKNPSKEWKASRTDVKGEHSLPLSNRPLGSVIKSRNSASKTFSAIKTPIPVSPSRVIEVPGTGNKSTDFSLESDEKLDRLTSVKVFSNTRRSLLPTGPLPSANQSTRSFNQAHIYKQQPPPTETVDPTAARRLKITAEEVNRIGIYPRIFLTEAYDKFGGKSAIYRYNALRNYLVSEKSGGIHRFSYFNTTWEYFMSLVYIFVLFLVPVAASFEKSGLDCVTISVFISVIYFLDLIVCINRLLHEEDMPALNLSQSRRHYIRKKLLVHVAATIPFSLILSLMGQSQKLQDLVLITHFARVKELSSIMSYNAFHISSVHQIRRVLNVGVSFGTMILSGFLLVIFLHLHGCTYFYFGRILEFSAESWQQITVLESPFLEQYSWAVFSAIGNTFPVTGYRPTDPIEQWITIILILIGATLYAILVGTISSFTFNLDPSGKLFKQKMDEVGEYMEYKKLGENIKDRVRRHYELKFGGKYFDEDLILSELNMSLRKDIAIHNCRDLIAKVPFLTRNAGDGRDENFTRSIAAKLFPEYYIAGDRIIEQEQIGNEMYFLASGTVDIEVNGNAVGILKEGSFFGEVGGILLCIGCIVGTSSTYGDD